VAGGAAQLLADAPSGRGGTWGPDGTIVFAPAPESGLSIVSGDGGSVTVLTQPTRDERSHRWPHLLPDGRTVLFTIQPAGRIYDDAIIAAVPLSGGVPRVVVEGGSSAQYAESGHLFYGKAGALFAMPFDPVAARATGAAIAVVDNARTNSLNGALPAGVSASGLLVYLPGENTGAAMSLITASRNGPSQVLLDRKLLDSSINLSHDGGRLAFMMVETQADIWILELESRGLRAVTSGAGTENYPVWSPDGSRIYYTTNTGGVTRTVSKAVDGSSAETDVTSNALFPRSISPDGNLLAGRAITRTSFDVVAVDVTNRKTSLLVGSPANESEPAFSPDGRLVAYQSDESGTNEVFVHEFRSGNKWQVTKGGGIQPRWSSGGREIVYRNGSTIFAVPVTVLPFSVAGGAEPVFSAPNLIGFDITADGKRLVAVQQSESTESPHLVLVGGWFEELKAKVRPAR
jgi:Tol biopolymer transport system component